jgi:hypothetical protein
VLQQCSRFQQHVIIRQERRPFAQPFHPGDFGSEVVRVVPVKYRLEARRVQKNGHCPNGSAKCRSWLALTSVRPEENFPAVLMALSIRSSRPSPLCPARY